jgi:NhaC family Na+:H+ antiporter
MLGLNRLGAIIAITIAGLVISYALGWPPWIGPLAGLLVLIWHVSRRESGRRDMWLAMGKGVREVQVVVWVLLLVACMIPAWNASGTVAWLTDWGLKLMDPRYMLVSSFLLSAGMGVLLGTATGTLSSIGIPLMGVGWTLGVPPGLVAGAVISGAMIGEIVSPFSGAQHLVASSTGVAANRFRRLIVPVVAAAGGLAALMYAGLDMRGRWSVPDSGPIAGAPDSAVLSPWLLIPAAVLLIGIVLRWGVVRAFLLSIAAAIVLGSWLQGVPWGEWPDLLWNGHAPAGGAAQGGGVARMIHVVALVAIVGAFNGILAHGNMISPYMDKLFGRNGGLLPVTGRAMALGFVMAVVSCTQTLPVMMTGRNALPIWEKRWRREDLACAVAGGPLLFPVLVPWNMMAVLCTTLLGVPTLDYAGAACILWLVPALVLVRAWRADRNRGIGAKRLTTLHGFKNEL